jgi:hypothetical protein
MTTLYRKGDRVLIDVASGSGGPPDWRPGVVTGDTNPVYGWTPAQTTSEPRVSRGPGWLDDEICHSAEIDVEGIKQRFFDHLGSMELDYGDEPEGSK